MCTLFSWNSYGGCNALCRFLYICLKPDTKRSKPHGTPSTWPHLLFSPTVSRMRSKGSRFTLGVWGLRVCSLDVAEPFATVRNRSQPSATVRNRSQPSAWGRYGRAYGKFCRRGRSWRFHMWRCFVSRGRRGTSWHSDVFCNVSKVGLGGRRNTFATFSEDASRCSFRGRRSTLDVSIVIWRGRRSTLDVSCCVFCANRIVRAASGGDKVQIHFVRWWKLMEASHETSKKSILR